MTPMNIFNIADYGAVRGNDCTKALADVVAAATNNGAAETAGTIYFPRGPYFFSSWPNMRGARGLVFMGECNPNGIGSVVSPYATQYAMPSSLLYTGSGSASAMPMAGATAVRFKDVFVGWAGSPSGYLLDFRESVGCVMEDCHVGPVYGAAINSPMALALVDYTSFLDVRRTYFYGGQYNIYGRIDTIGKADTILFTECGFSQYLKLAIVNPDRGWTFLNGHWEPSINGNPGAIGFVGNLASKSLTLLAGNDLCDAGPASNTPWITLIGGCQATRISGEFTSPASAPNILVAGDGVQGLEVSGSTFGAGIPPPGGYIPTGIDLAKATNLTGFAWFANGYDPALKRPINGTPPAGSLVCL